MASDVSAKKLDEALLALAHSPGGLRDIDAIGNDKRDSLLNVLPQDWLPDYQATALKDLIPKLVRELAEKPRVVLQAAFQITDGTDISDEYAEKVKAWTDRTGFHARLIDLDDCMPTRLRPLGPGANRSDPDMTIPVRTTRKWWEDGRKLLVQALMEKHRWPKGWLEKWQEFPPPPIDVTPEEVEVTVEGKHELPIRVETAIEDEAEARKAPTISQAKVVEPAPAPMVPIDLPGKQPAHGTTQIDQPYIHRNELESRFRELIDKNTKLIVLRGQPGMGKTKLAEEITRDHEKGALAPLIRIGSRVSGDLQGVLSGLGISTREAVDKDPWTFITMIVSHAEKAPSFLILDDLDDADEILDRLPRTTISTIVLTCRRSRRIDASQIIDVPEMEPREASELIRSRLPELDDEGIEALISQYHYHPLVLDKACAVYLQQDRSLEGYLDILQEEAAKIAEYAQESQGAALQAILKLATSLIKQRDPLAYHLLVYLTFIEENYSLREVRYLFRSYPPTREIAPGIPRLLQAVEVLSTFGFATSIDEHRGRMLDRWLVRRGFVNAAEAWHAFVLLTLRRQLDPEFWGMYAWLAEVRPQRKQRDERKELRGRQYWWLRANLCQISMAVYAMEVLKEEKVDDAPDTLRAIHDFVTRRALDPKLVTDLQIALNIDTLIEWERDLRMRHSADLLSPSEGILRAAQSLRVESSRLKRNSER